MIIYSMDHGIIEMYIAEPCSYMHRLAEFHAELYNLMIFLLQEKEYLVLWDGHDSYVICTSMFYSLCSFIFKLVYLFVYYACHIIRI